MSNPIETFLWLEKYGDMTLQETGERMLVQDAEIERLKGKFEGQPEEQPEDQPVCLAEKLAAANAEIERLKAIVDQVDDVLVVNWVAAKDGDYRTALAELVSTNIAERDDPAISPTARARQDEVAQLRAALRETREAFLICYAAVRDHADGECPCANILARYADLAGEAEHG